MSYSPSIAVAANSAANAAASDAAAALTAAAEEAPEPTAESESASESGQAASAVEAPNANDPATQDAPAVQQPASDAQGEGAATEPASAGTEPAGQGASAAGSETAQDAEGGQPADQPADADDTAQTSQRATLEASIASATGGFYTVRLAYDGTAGIPEGAQLSIVEENPALTDEEKADPANAARPRETERFLDRAAYEQRVAVVAKGLGLDEDNDAVFFSKLLSVSLKADGKPLALAAPVEVTVETNALDVADSDALEAAVLLPDEGLSGNDQAIRDHRVTSDGKSARSLGGET